MHGLNEELGRHRGREGKSECTLCGAECESVVHVLWECYNLHDYHDLHTFFTYICTYIHAQNVMGGSHGHGTALP